MTPFGYPFYVWLKANPLAQWLLGIAAAYAAFRLWLWRKIVSVRREVQKEAVEEVVKQIEEQTHERVEEAREAAKSTDDYNADQLRKLRAKDPNNRSRLP
jgi:hypothetical protein